MPRFTVIFHHCFYKNCRCPTLLAPASEPSMLLDQWALSDHKRVRAVAKNSCAPVAGLVLVIVENDADEVGLCPWMSEGSYGRRLPSIPRGVVVF